MVQHFLNEGNDYEKGKLKNEQFKYDIIKNLVENNCNKKSAASKLNCSVRGINRLTIKYNLDGKNGFVHRNRGRIPASAIPADSKSKIMNEDLGYSISDTTLNRWLREQEIISPKVRRKTKRNMKKLWKAKLDLTKSEKVKMK